MDHKLTAKISDFGFSIQLPQSMGSKTLVTAVDGLPGTDGYRPPEYSDRKFSVLSDMYSYGVVSLCLGCVYISMKVLPHSRLCLNAIVAC